MYLLLVIKCSTMKAYTYTVNSLFGGLCSVNGCIYECQSQSKFISINP